VNEKGTRTHFAARSGDLVLAVFLVDLVCVVRLFAEQNEQDKPNKLETLPWSRRPMYDE
jgi:hypothetical protein